MLFRYTNYSIVSLFSMVSLFFGNMHAQEQRQPIGQRMVQPLQSNGTRQPVAERGDISGRSVVVARPEQSTQIEQTSSEVVVPVKNKQHKKDKSKKKKEKNKAIVVVQPEQQQKVVVDTPTVTPKKKEHHKKDKRRQTLGDRVNTTAIVNTPPSQMLSRPEIGQRTPVVRPQVVTSNHVVVPVESHSRQVIGQRSTPIQRSPVAMEMHRPAPSNSAVVVPTPTSTFVSVPTPIQRVEHPHTITGFAEAPVVVAQPQRPVIVPRPLPQVIVIDRGSALYPTAALTPYFISRRGDQIQLNNGSSWAVRYRDQRAVRHWNYEDIIVIQTGGFFNWSTYKLVNYTRGTSIDVELINPQSRGMLSHWITEINPIEGYLRLQDGSIWKMSAHELLNWQVDDDVIIGINKNWFTNDSSYVLINPRVKNRLVAVFSINL